MTESIVLAVFAAMLVAGIAAGVPIVWILIAGFALFSGYALKQGHSVREVAHMAGSGMKSVRDVLILYLIVGALLFDLGPDGAVCVDDLDASNPNRFTYNRHFSPFSPVTGNVAGRAVLLFTRGI